MNKSLFPVLFPLLAILFFSSCYTNHATVSIPAGEEFVLGELENSNFRVKLKNLGKEVIEIKAVEKKSGERTQSFGLDGRSNAELYVSKREKVILSNPTEVEVKVKARLNKNVGGMRYQAIRD